MSSRILHLNLHKQFFDDIANRKKKTEWRERTDYWSARLDGRAYDLIVLRNGYSADAPELHVEWKGFRKVVRNGEPQCQTSHGSEQAD
jgi:hypothetical protein